MSSQIIAIFIWISAVGTLLVLGVALWDWITYDLGGKKISQSKIMICPSCKQVVISPRFDNMMHCPDCGSLCFIKK